MLWVSITEEQESLIEFDKQRETKTLFQNLVIFAFFDWKSEFVRRIQPLIKINIRHLKTSTHKYNHKDCSQLQNRVIFHFMLITGFWYWVVFQIEFSTWLLMAFWCFCNTIALKPPKSREKNEGRRYFYYLEITTTEYKWTTKRILQKEKRVN
jgi:hypothetical protein